jgi:hypothetical protein
VKITYLCWKKKGKKRCSPNGHVFILPKFSVLLSVLLDIILRFFTHNTGIYIPIDKYNIDIFFKHFPLLKWHAMFFSYKFLFFTCLLLKWQTNKNWAHEKLIGRQKKLSCIISQGALSFFFLLLDMWCIDLICVILDDW